MCGGKSLSLISPTYIESLPDELLFDNILVRLPADFLHDIARLVCRRWCHIIRSDAFISKHIQQKSSYGLVLSLPRLPHAIYVTATRGRIETSELSCINRNEITATSCNGLALEVHSIHDDVKTRSLHVINPATKQSFLLPSIPKTNRSYVYHHHSCIAYSAASMEYKVTLPYTDHFQPTFLDIVTVGVDKSWRHVEIPPLSETLESFIRFPLSSEGFLHWGKERYCLTLNVETEMMTLTEVPIQRYLYHSFYYLSRGSYITLLAKRHRELSWEVWEMRPAESGEWRKAALSNIDLEPQKYGDSSMDGYDHDLMEIISRLREDSSALEIIPILGLGGMGKTTLARNAYNHPSIIYHFWIRAWSVISHEYSLRGIISELLRSMKADWSISDSEDQLIDKVRKNLDGKRYLIVLDDIWSLEAWDSLRFMFPDNGNGSRILLTSRLASVASSISRTYIHQMCLLDKDASWRVCREKIFKGDPCPSQLESIGKMIATSCRGHPLCIAVVSGILAADQTEAAWKDISENILNTIAYDYDKLALHILSLSYTYLPHHLRPCFLYLAIFPEDHEIHVSKLVKLWVAEGFLNESEYKSYEEMGEERVEDLVQRSLVSVTKRKPNGRIKSIAVHDLLRDLCLRQAEKDNFILHVGGYDTYMDYGGRET